MLAVWRYEGTRGSYPYSAATLALSSARLICEGAAGEGQVRTGWGRIETTCMRMPPEKGSAKPCSSANHPSQTARQLDKRVRRSRIG